MKRILSLLMVFAMVIAMVPNVFAANDSIDFDELIGKLVILDSIEEIPVSLAEGATSKTYKWTPEKMGSLSLYIYEWELPEGTEFDVTMTQGENSITYSQKAEDADFALEVAAGVEVSIKVSKTSEAPVEFSMYGVFDVMNNTADDPIMIQWEWNEEMTEATATVTAEPGTTYFGGRGMGGMVVCINDFEEILVEGGSDPRSIGVFEIVNYDTVAAEYSLTLSFPKGTWDNPDELEIGYNGADVVGDGQPYMYTWTAEKDGYLTISMSSYCYNWTYNINNITTYAYGDLHTSNDDVVISSETIKVSAGDQIEVMIGTADNAAEYVYFTASAYCVDVMEFAQIDPIMNVEQTEAIANVLVPVGTVYYGGNSMGGMLLSINGGEAVLLEGTPRTPPTFAITNDGDKAAVYTLKLTFPEGSWNNPADLQIGENTAPVVGNGQPYMYNWTAEKDGYLTVSMLGDNWTYAINNMTTPAYGDNHASDDEPVVATETIKVSAGDQIKIAIGTADNSAGNVAFTAAFEEVTYTPGNLNGDEIVDEDDAIYLLRHVLLGEDSFPVDQPVDYNNDGVTDEDDAIYLLRHVLLGEEAFPL